MAYNRVRWEDFPNTDTPIIAENLNRMDEQIETNTLDLDGLKDGTVPAKIASKLGSKSVGTSSTPIYIGYGTAKECSLAEEVKDVNGLVSNKAVFQALKSGLCEKLGVKDVGSGKKLFFLKKGEPTESATTVASGKRLMFLNKGELTASTSNVGSKGNPVFLKDGVLTACENGSGLTFTTETLKMTGFTLSTEEEKKTATIVGTKTYDKTDAHISGVTAITFSNKHHEIYFSDYSVSINADGKIEAKITVPSHAEVRGAKTDITVKVSVISINDTVEVTPEYSPTYG